MGDVLSDQKRYDEAQRIMNLILPYTDHGSLQDKLRINVYIILSQYNYRRKDKSLYFMKFCKVQK